MRWIKGLLGMGFALGLAGCSTVGGRAPQAAGEDAGYFLSMKQKGQLIGTGRIQDEQGVWYDVWLVPGYVQPAQRAREHLQEGAGNFGEYFQAEKYRKIARHGGDALEWGFEDCLMDTAVRGVPRAWGRHFSAANRRMQTRVFGWWLAYPWALIESSVETVVRVPLGLGGAALGTAWGVAVVPGYYAVNSAVAGTWNAGVEGVLLPTAACVWNTAVAPPLALAGQKPSLDRADGFWVTALTPDQLQNPAAVPAPIQPEDVSALATWGHRLLATSRPFDERRQALQIQKRVEFNALTQKFRKVEADLRAEEEEGFHALSQNLSLEDRGALDHLQRRAINSTRVSQASDALRQYLQEQGNLSAQEITQMINLLHRHPPQLGPSPAPLRPKTDPVDRSLEIMKEIP